MSIDTDEVQKIVDEAQQEYLQRTQIPDDLVRTNPDFRTHNTCEESQSIETMDFNSTLHSTYISRQVQKIVNCELSKYVRSLDGKSDNTESISSGEFFKDMVKTAAQYHCSSHIFLPDKIAYEEEMRKYDSYDSLHLRPQLSIHWFNSNDVFEDKGFLVETGVAFRQRPQGDNPVISSSLDEELAEDNGENRLQVKIHPDLGVMNVDFRSKSSLFKLDTNDPLIHTLELPDPSKIQ